MLWTIDHAAERPLREQIVTCVRRAITSRDLSIGDRLPPAAELAEALSVDRNTVLAVPLFAMAAMSDGSWSAPGFVIPLATAIGAVVVNLTTATRVRTTAGP